MKSCTELGLKPCRLHEIGSILSCVVHQFHHQISQRKLSLAEIIKYGTTYRRSMGEDHLDCLLATTKYYFPELLDKIESLIILL